MCYQDGCPLLFLYLNLHQHSAYSLTQVYKLVLLDLPGLLFFSTYTLLVLFWAEIYHQVPKLFLLQILSSF